MSPEAWIAIVGLAVTVIIFCIGIVRAHGASDRKFQEETGKSNAKMAEQISHLRQDYESLHQWKNIGIPQQFERANMNIFGVIDRIEKDVCRRLDRIEKHLNGHLK